MQATITAFQTVANPSGQIPSDNYKWWLMKDGVVAATQTVSNTDPVTFAASAPGNYAVQVGRLSDTGAVLSSVVQSNTVNIPFPGFDVPKTVTLSL